jgi:hypothetical protein
MSSPRHPHAIAKVNDGLYGNTNSWIGGTTNSFIGLNLGATPVAIHKVAFGRDNLGSFIDRTLGTYTLQYTTVTNPTAATPDGSWTTIGTLQYVSAGGANFATPSRRHLFSFNPVAATGFRIRTDSGSTSSANTICLDEIELYGPGIPAVTTLAASGVTATGATLNGTVNPGNGVTTAYFQYGLDASYGSFSATNTLVATNVTLSDSNLITDLFPGTTYHFRLVATNRAGASYGADQAFTTGGSATLAFAGGGLALLEEGGAFAPGNLATGRTAFAQDEIGVAPHAIAKVNDGVYGNSNSWIGGSASTFIAMNLSPTPLTISMVAFGRDNLGSFTDRTLGTYTLQYTSVTNPTAATPDTNWNILGVIQYAAAGATNFSYPSRRHLFAFNPVAATGFRIKVNAAMCLDEIELYGPGIPVVTTLPASGSITTNATLGGTVNPSLAATAAYFQYGTTTNYGAFTATNSLPPVNATLAVTSLLTGLSPATTYHFRLVAGNSWGSGNGGDQTFYTGVVAPAVVTLSAGGITATNAALNGTVDPGNGATAAYFQYGLTTNYGSFSATNSLPALVGAIPISNLAGLSPAATYHFRLVAANSAGTNVGTDQVLTTPRLPATNIITTLADAGPGSLRDAILNSISGDTINLTTNGTIVLASGELLVTNNLTIIGPGATNLFISGNGFNRLFTFAAGTTNSISGISLPAYLDDSSTPYR